MTSAHLIARDADPGPVRRHGGGRQEARDLRVYRRDPDARERLIRAHLPLANAIARRFHRGGRVPLDDLQQVAALGVIKALDRFDPEKGAAFGPFAGATIRGEIWRYMRDFTWTVRPPRDLQERAVRIQRERAQLTSLLGRSPTAADLAERIGCTIEEIVDASQAACARGSDSLDRPVAAGEDEGDTLGERLGGEDLGFAAAEASVTLDLLLATLPARERVVLGLRLRDDLTQAEIGRRTGYSQMHVSRILRVALTRLEANAASLSDGPATRPHDALSLD
jgi:RNA polymerase sigma-B factor